MSGNDPESEIDRKHDLRVQLHFCSNEDWKNEQTRFLAPIIDLYLLIAIEPPMCAY